MRRWLRRLARYRRQHPLRAAGFVAAGIVVLGLGWIGWLVLDVRSEVAQVEEQAQVMRSALVRGDVAGARRALRAFQEAADDADASTHGRTWSALGRLPMLGDDAGGVALASSVVADLGREGLTPVIEAADLVTANSFQPVDRRFPVDRIVRLQDPARRSEQAFSAAGTRLDEVDSAAFVPPVAAAYDDLHRLVLDAHSTLESVYRAARLMPQILRPDKVGHYLLVMQNNAEARSSGGLPGSLSLVESRKGRVEIVSQVDMAKLGGSSKPILPLTPEERRLFGDLLGTVGVNATLTPDFPRAADLIKARWEVTRERRLDGVLFVDPVMISYLLDSLGEVAVPGYPPITAGNVTARVENEIYIATPDAEEHSEYQERVAKAVFDVFAEGGGDSADIIRALVTGVQEGRVRMHFFDDDVQDEIARTLIAGEFVAAPGDPPVVGVYVNDAGPTKMQYYLRQEAWLASRRCVEGRQELVMSVTFTNAAPKSGLPDAITGEFVSDNQTRPGQQLLVVYVSAPVGGKVEAVAIDGQAVANLVTSSYAGHDIATIGVLLDPGQTQEIEVLLRSGKGQEADPRLEVTPGAQRGSPNATAASSCSTR